MSSRTIEGENNIGSFIESFMREVNPRGVSAPTAFERGIVRADPSTFGMFGERNNTNPFEQPEFGEIVEEDTLIQRLMSMLGGIGQSELGSIWADPTVEEILRRNSIRMNPDAPFDIQQATGVTAEGLSELSEVIQEIENAGGYEEWLAQQPTGDPGDLFEPDTELEEEIDIGVDTTLEDEIGVEPDMPIDIPFPTLPPREEGEGEQEGEGQGGNGQGETGETGTSSTSGTSGTTDQTGETREIPDYSGIGNEDYGYPGGLPGGGRGGTIYDVPVQDDPGFRVIAGVPFIGTGSGGEGGSGGGGGGGMLSRPTYNFRPITASIGYQPVAVPRAILPQYAPITNGLFSEYLA